MTTSRSKSLVSVTLNGKRAREILALLAAELNPIADRLSELLDSNWPLVLQVYRRRPRRSLDENALMWAWLRVIGKECGFDDAGDFERMKCAFVMKYLGTQQTPFGPAPVSTSNLTHEEFGHLLDGINREAAELGLQLPATPEEWEAWEAA